MLCTHAFITAAACVAQQKNGIHQPMNTKNAALPINSFNAHNDVPQTPIYLLVTPLALPSLAADKKHTFAAKEERAPKLVG